jgi:hypothetical protein
MIALSSRVVSAIAQTSFVDAPRVGNPMEWDPMINLDDGEWRNIAQQLVLETDSTKLAILANQLCAELDREEAVTMICPPASGNVPAFAKAA